MEVNLTTACKMVGISRTTMYNKYVNTNVLTVKKLNNQQVVDVSELIRVFGNVKQLDDDGKPIERHTELEYSQDERTLLTVENARLHAENEQLKARLADKEQHLQDMRNTLLLLDHKKSWWKFW